MPSLLALSNHIGGNVLDYGCGAGNFMIMLTREDRLVDDFDASPRLIQIARGHYLELHFYDVSKSGFVSSGKSMT